MVIRISGIDNDIVKLCSSTIETFDNNYIERLSSYFCVGSTNLKNVNLKKCEYIGSSAFHHCINLEKIDLPKVQEIKRLILGECSKVSEINIGSSIQTIASDAFGCGSNPVHCTITIDLPENSISGAPWGHPNATVVWTGTQAPNQAPRRLMMTSSRGVDNEMPQPIEVMRYENDTRTTDF